MVALGHGHFQPPREQAQFPGRLSPRPLDDLLLVRRLPPRLTNVGKRLVRSPKICVRDSGLVHALLGLSDKEALLGHPVAGPSWEAMAIENIAAIVGDAAELSFYRTSAGAEVDLVLSWPDGPEWAVEVKRSSAPKLGRGLRAALGDIAPQRSFVVYPGDERFPIGADTEALPLAELCRVIQGRSPAHQGRSGARRRGRPPGRSGCS